MKFDNRNCLVTGGAGFIGSALVEELVRLGANVTVIAGEPVLIAVRDTPVSDSNPYSTEEVVASLEEEYADKVASGMVKVIVIPDISSVNYGRGVGYEINEFVPPGDVGSISATDIRNKLDKN